MEAETVLQTLAESLAAFYFGLLSAISDCLVTEKLIIRVGKADFNL